MAKKDDNGNDIVNDTVVDEVASDNKDAVEVAKSEPAARDTGKEEAAKAKAQPSVEERLDRIEKHLRSAFNDFR